MQDFVKVFLQWGYCYCYLSKGWEFFFTGNLKCHFAVRCWNSSMSLHYVEAFVVCLCSLSVVLLLFLTATVCVDMCTLLQHWRITQWSPSSGPGGEGWQRMCSPRRRWSRDTTLSKVNPFLTRSTVSRLHVCFSFLGKAPFGAWRRRCGGEGRPRQRKRV